MIKAVRLKTEQLTNPMGVDFQMPFLSWLPVGAKYQTAYCVNVFCEGKEIWSSGKVKKADRGIRLPVSIRGRKRVDWEVTLWDENDRKGETAAGWFERGLDKKDWQAKWIDPETGLQEERHPASYLRKVFCLPEEKAGSTEEKTRLYITAHGIYDAYLNGVHIDGYLLAPGSSQYDKRLQVQTYDVSELLKDGENELLVTLGDGWYRGSTHNDMDINVFGTDTALLCQLERNEQIILISDESWQASQSGPLGLNDHMKGEVYDARKTISDWHPVTVREYGFENLMGTNTVPVTAHECFSPKLLKTPSGETVLDFGQNIAGYVKFSLQAAAGQRMILTHGETLDEDGNFTIQNFQSPRSPQCFQRVDYVCRDGLNEYHPTKCYFGFRYVKVEGDIEITGEEFCACAIYSDMEQTGFFECGNEQVNQLVKNALWSMKGNFVDVPTDCPTREKSGYSGDLVTFCHTAMYLMDCYPVLRRWLEEQAATQFADGCVRQIAPNGRERGHWDGGAGWCDSMELIPWRLMRRYEETSVAEQLYDVIRRWMEFCLSRAKATREENQDLPEELQPYFADQGMHWGEWLEPDTSAMQILQQIGMHGEPEVATAFLSYGCMAMSEMAEKLGKESDAAYFREAGEKAREAYRFRYVKNGEIEKTHRQCRYVRPLSMGLLDESEKNAAAAELAENIKARGNHLNTGFLSTHELCRVLTDNGYAKTAYDLLLQQEYPGWLYPVSKGATTIWENWQGIAEDGTVRDSLNHYSFGSVVGWLFDRVCGIVAEDGKIIIRPYPEQRLGYAKAVYHSPMGKILSSWRYEGEKISYEIEIPCGCEAKIYLPDGREYCVEPGKYNL